MKNKILREEEVGKKLADIIHTCGYEGIDASSIVGYNVNKRDILLTMKNGQRIKLKNALTVYSEIKDATEKAHYSTGLYLRLGMPYSTFEEITKELSIEQIRKLNEEIDEIDEIYGDEVAGEMYGVKTLMPITDKKGKVIGAYIESEEPTQLEEQTLLGEEIEDIEQRGIKDNNQTNPVDIFKALKTQLENMEDKETSSVF